MSDREKKKKSGWLHLDRNTVTIHLNIAFNLYTLSNFNRFFILYFNNILNH